MDIPPTKIHKTWFSRHLVAGYAFLFVVFMAAVGLVYYLKYLETKPAASCRGEVARGGCNGSLNNLPSDKFADWQTYSNAEYGLEFKYPKEYVLSDYSELDIPGELLINVMHLAPGDDLMSNDFSLEAYKMSLGEAIIKEKAAVKANPNARIVSMRETRLFGLPGQVLEEATIFGDSLTVYYFQKGDMTYIISGDSAILDTFTVNGSLR